MAMTAHNYCAIPNLLVVFDQLKAEARANTHPQYEVYWNCSDEFRLAWWMDNDISLQAGSKGSEFLDSRINWMGGYELGSPVSCESI
jgi:hypothetical protein